MKVNLVILANLLFSLLVSGCETFHGVQSKEENFPKLERYTCLEAAVKSVPEVEFIKYSENDHVEKAWSNHKISIKTYMVEYKVKMISDDQNESALVLIQSVSEDPSPKYNYNHFYSSAGNRNRKVYSAEELNLFHKAVVAINSQVAISCKTQNFSPIFYN
jgi:hypothetical protein